jgi:aminoglycoside/choline kinase family phosphotransferase
MSQEIFDIIYKELSPSNIIPLAQEASIRNYYRLEYSDKTQILCIDQNFKEEPYPFIEIAKFLEKNNFRVPKIYSIDKTKNILILEDIGEKDLSFIQDENEYIEQIKKAMDSLFLLQKLKPIPIVQSRSFDLEKFKFEFNFTLNAFELFKKEYSIQIKLQHELYAFFEELIQFLAGYEPKVICHRDFHSRNILYKNGEQVWIDFQDMMMGTPFYDLSSILYDAYKPISLPSREELYFYFIENNSIKIKRAREVYLAQCLQRSFKALGTYLYQFHVKKNMRFKDSITKCLINLEEINQIGMFTDQSYVFFHLFRKELESNEKFN